MTRIYVASTFAALRGLLRGEELAAAPVRAFAVTASLRKDYEDHDDEELECAATSAAAEASVHLLATQPPTSPDDARRLVVVCDVADAMLEPDEASGGPAVFVAVPPAMTDVACVLCDDLAACADVHAAVSALKADDSTHVDHDTVRQALDSVENHDLLWFATQELGELVGDDHRRHD